MGSSCVLLYLLPLLLRLSTSRLQQCQQLVFDSQTRLGPRMASRLASHRPLLRRSPLNSYAMSRSFSSYLVTPGELNDALKANSPSRLSTAPRTIPVCASWFLPNDPQKRTGLQVFKQGHIPNARFFDLDKVADTTSPYPHMLPSPQVFKDALSQLGIARDDTVVVYDTAELGIFSAPRVAWTSVQSSV